MERVENITGVPETNSEWLQLLRYEKEQFYNQHHDLIGKSSLRSYFDDATFIRLSQPLILALFTSRLPTATPVWCPYFHTVLLSE